MFHEHVIDVLHFQSRYCPLFHNHKVFRSGRIYVNVVRAVERRSDPHSVSGVERSFHLQLINRSVLLEITICDGTNLLLGNHCFPPDTKIYLLQSYFSRLDRVLDTQYFRVFLFGKSNIPNFDSEHSLSMDKCHYYSEQ